MNDGRADFDFLFGRWRVRNRKLRNVIDPSCTDWIEFDASAHTEPIIGGFGNIDRICSEASPGEEPFEGFTLRQFDPQTRRWRIWWASSRRPGYLDPPVQGAWRDGKGIFECDDVLGGLPVKVRFDWTTDGTDSARWEQSFSYDEGQTWQANWTMDFSRIAE